ncbi:MAG: hypothetical protein JO020_02185 [Chloroflexi bacterium]|nr:hypothetical protein [Chloroflexota bacterium]
MDQAVRRFADELLHAHDRALVEMLRSLNEGGTVDHDRALIDNLLRLYEGKRVEHDTAHTHMLLNVHERKRIDQIGAVDKGVQILLSLKYKDMLHQQLPLPPLADVEFRSHSQNGEDGILLYIFSLVGTTNKKTVEMCAGTGIECNSANLILNHKWDGLLFDGDPQYVAWGRDFFARSKDTHWRQPTFVHAWITADNVNDVIAAQGVAGEIDLFSLDMDGVDYWIWKAIDCVSPRVVVLEFNWIWGADRSVTIPYDPKFVNTDPSGRNGGNGFAYFGGSLPAFVKLAKTKGYRLIGTESWGFNAFFLRNDVGPDILPEVDAAECFKIPMQLATRTSQMLSVMDPAWQWVEV